VSNGLLFTSGILPIKIKSSEKIPLESSINEQLEVIFENLKQILKEVSLTPYEVVKTTIYITDSEGLGV
jgi:2-iminobutanoate/2-iminopropanoate deaminase